jgi:hypothetical protein
VQNLSIQQHRRERPSCTCEVPRFFLPTCEHSLAWIRKRHCRAVSGAHCSRPVCKCPSSRRTPCSRATRVAYSTHGARGIVLGAAAALELYDSHGVESLQLPTNRRRRQSPGPLQPARETPHARLADPSAAWPEELRPYGLIFWRRLNMQFDLHFVLHFEWCWDKAYLLFVIRSVVQFVMR